MRSKPVQARARALEDVDEALEFYLAEADPRAALRFIDAVNQAYRHIGRLPKSGSPRYALELGVPGLRTWRLRRYPFVVVYFEVERAVEVWRVLHAERDIPADLRHLDEE